MTSGSIDARAELSGDVTTAGALATTIANNAVSNAKLRDSAALSVIGRDSNSSGDPADIVAASDGQVLQRVGTTLAFASVPGLTNIGIGFFGTGTDGAITFDGTTTLLGIVPASTTTRGTTYNYYALTRDIYCTAITVNSGVAIFTNGFRVFCKGTITNNGVIGCWGDDGGNGTIVTPGSGGAARGASNVLGGSGAGGGGGVHTANGAGGTGGSGVGNPRGFVNSNGGAGHGGNGGANSAGTAGGTAGGVSLAGATAGDMDNINQAIEGHQVNSTNRFGGASGGGGGRGRDVAPGPQGSGGGGGAGGACVVVCGLSFAGSGKIIAYGGNGGSGFGGAGGGGGGGGGWVVVVYGYGTAPTTNVTGGAAGTSTSGSAGTAGGNGLSYLFAVGA